MVRSNSTEVSLCEDEIFFYSVSSYLKLSGTNQMHLLARKDPKYNYHLWVGTTVVWDRLVQTVWLGPSFTTPFMIFSAMYAICKGPKLEAERSQSSRLLVANIKLFANISDFVDG